MLWSNRFKFKSTKNLRVMFVLRGEGEVTGAYCKRDLLNIKCNKIYCVALNVVYFDQLLGAACSQTRLPGRWRLRPTLPGSRVTRRATRLATHAWRKWRSRKKIYILYQLSGFLMSRHDIKLKDLGKSLRGLNRFKIL